MANIGDNTIFSPNVFDSGILGRKGVFETYLLDDSNGTGVLNQFGTDAQAAYSAYDLGNKRGSVVETGETVYGDFVTHESDFSADGDGWSGTLGTASFTAGPIGGQNDVGSFTVDSSSGVHYSSQALMANAGVSESVVLQLYIPSSNISIDGYRIYDAGGGIDLTDNAPATDSWINVSITDVSLASQLRIQPKAGGLSSFLGNGTDVIYYRNVTITELDTYRTLDVAYHNPAVRVRRDSDNIHKSFAGGEFTQIENWVNEDVETYASDFSAGADNWIGQFGTVAGNIDSIGGQDDNLRYVPDGAITIHQIYNQTDIVLPSLSATVSFDIYIPSTNTDLDGYRLTDNTGTAYTASASPTQDEWVSVSHTFTFDGSSGRLTIRFTSGGVDSFSGSGESVYIRNITITQLTANGHVATWYDQSGVGVVSTDHDSSVDGWGDYSGAGATLTADYDSGDAGHDSCLRIVADSTQYDRASLALVAPAGPVRVTFDYKSVVLTDEHFVLTEGTPDTSVVTGPEMTSDTWQTISTVLTLDGDMTELRFYVNNASGAIGDELLIDNVRFETLNKAHNDATQATADSQPKIVDAGSLVTDANGNVALDFDGVDDLLSNSSISITEATAFLVAQMDTVQNTGFFQLGTINQTSSLLQQASGGGMIARRKSGATPREVIWSAPSAGSQELWSVLLVNDRSEAWEDGVSEGTDETDTTQTAGSLCVLGALDTSGTFPLDGKMSAAIFYDTDKSTDRAAIEQAISNTITTALS